MKMHAYFRVAFFVMSAVVGHTHAFAQAAAQAPPQAPANGAVLPPTKSLLMADCPTLKQVVLTIPEMDPLTGTQKVVLQGGSWVPQVIKVNFDYVASYGKDGKCAGNGAFAADMWDAQATKQVLDAYRDEVLTALKTAVSTASIREEQLTVLKTSMYEDLNTRLAAPLLKEISALKARIAELEAAQSEKGKQ